MSNQAIAPGRQAKKVRSRFQRLWDEAELMAKENLELDKTLDALVHRVDTEVRKAEKSLAETVRLAVHKQLDFAQKKSLLKWHRAELSEWIGEHINQLMDMGQLDEALQNRLALLRAVELGIELDEDSKVSPVEQLRQYMDQQAVDELARMRSDNAGEDDGSDDWFEQNDEGSNDSDYDDAAEEAELEELLRRLHEEFGDFGEFDGQSVDPERTSQKNQPGFDDAVFKRLFRQTAAALHPDKETDPAQQRVKHELMAELLRARKERDLITILRLHEQHANADSGLSAEDEQQLEAILVDYLSQQQARMDIIIHRSSMHQWVFHEFYHKNPATVKRRIKSHISKIDTRRQGLDLFVTRVKTLKALKEMLADRYKQHRFNNSWF